MPGDESVLREFKKNLRPEVLGDFVVDVWNEMKLAGEAGSLLKIEETITNLVKEAEEAWLTRRKDVQVDLNGNKKIEEQTRFNLKGIKNQMFWEEAEELLIDALKRFAEEASNGDSYPRKLFAENATDGFAFIDVISKKYDVVLMNPPFGDSSAGSKGYIEKKYPRTKNDLYAAFVERMLELLHEKGFIGIISSRTGFLLSSYTKWREEILMQESSLHCVADLGFGVLEAMVETAAYIIEKVPSSGRSAIFYRLLKEDEKSKGEKLYETIVNEKRDKEFIVKLESFSLVPNSPFSYWVSDRIRYKFKEFLSFEGNEGTVKQGLTTGDDFRFVRTNWEVSHKEIISASLKEWRNLKKEEQKNQHDFFLHKTYCNVYWANFVKGGEYSPYYSDTHLVVNWGRDGLEIKSLVGKNGRLASRPQNTDYYFLPGLTWPRRSIKGYSPRELNSGCIFSDKGPTAFLYDQEKKNEVLATINSSLVSFLFTISTTYNWDVGIFQKMPVISNISTKELVDNILLAKRNLDYSDETTHVFYSSSLIMEQKPLSEYASLLYQEEKLSKEEIKNLQELIDKVTFEIYQISEKDKKQILEEIEVKENENTEDNIFSIYTQKFLQLLLGCVFGRWDVRMAFDPTLAPKIADPFDPLPICSPGMLLSPDGLPAREGQIVSEEWLRARENVLDIPENIPKPTIPNGEYPLKIDWDGILVDDPGHMDDIVERVKDVFGLIWKDKAQDIENEACELLNVKSLRDYFRKKFFDFHIKRYSKSRRMAPIYWQLSSKNRNYSLWIYYHRLTSDTLFLALQKYIIPKLEYEETRFSEMKQKLDSEKESLPRSQITKMEKEVEKKADFVVELKEFRDTMEKIALSGYDPDFDDGVILNMAPLHEVIPWKEPAKYWKELQAGEYDWAHIAMKHWPERVKGKCRKDKSLAIAHGMEGLYNGNSN